MRNKKAFTLAEILVTLVMVGVIAAMTIPSLVNNINNATNVAQLKKTFSTLQQAFNLIAIDAGGSILNDSSFNCSGSACHTTGAANAINAFATKLNIVKNCGNGMGCWYASPIRYLGSGTYWDSSNIDASFGSGFGKAVLADGTILSIDINNTGCTYVVGSSGNPLYGTVCGDIYVDVNGASGPNKFGRDVFVFWIARTGIYPHGIYNDSYSCDVNSSAWGTSGGCSGKVLTEGAMNY